MVEAENLLWMPSILSDGMVLQQGKPIRVWGNAAKGERMTVVLESVDKSMCRRGATRADSEGYWSLELVPLDASFSPFAMTISAGSAQRQIRDILIGEVWLAAGQSNMHLPVQYIIGGEDLLRSANNPHVRSFGQDYVINEYSSTPQRDVGGGMWIVADSPGSLLQRDVSGIAYTFALHLFAMLNQDGRQVPIAIINSATGSTSIHAWLSRDALAYHPFLNARTPTDWLAHELDQATAQFNHKIAPLLPFALRGFLWSQGENDASEPVYYGIALRALIETWREAFDVVDAPFIAAQLHPFVYNDDPLATALMREAQIEACAGAGKAVAVPIHDIPLEWNTGDFAYKHPIHPLEKAPVGRRMARAAGVMAYGQPTGFPGPMYHRSEFVAESAIVHFTSTFGGLKIGGGGELRGFAVCGRDRLFHPARATIKGRTVEVRTAAVDRPCAVTYAFTSNNQHSNLSNAADEPASPFRSDRVPSTYWHENEPESRSTA